jgi:hypothetical protein
LQQMLILHCYQVMCVAVDGCSSNFIFTLHSRLSLNYNFQNEHGMCYTFQPLRAAAVTRCSLDALQPLHTAALTLCSCCVLLPGHAEAVRSETLAILRCDRLRIAASAGH